MKRGTVFGKGDQFWQPKVVWGDQIWQLKVVRATTFSCQKWSPDHFWLPKLVAHSPPPQDDGFCFSPPSFGRTTSGVTGALLFMNWSSASTYMAQAHYSMTGFSPSYTPPCMVLGPRPSHTLVLIGLRPLNYPFWTNLLRQSQCIYVGTSSTRNF